MKTVIIFASKHGTTEKTAHRIASAIENADVYSVKQAQSVDLSKYGIVILGCSIHAGNSQRSMKQFCKRHQDLLLEKKLALFLSCLNTKEFENSRKIAYPEILQKHAFAYELTGGEYLIERMNFIERFLVKKIVGVTKTQSLLDEGAIQRFVQATQKMIG